MQAKGKLSFISRCLAASETNLVIHSNDSSERKQEDKS